MEDQTPLPVGRALQPGYISHTHLADDAHTDAGVAAVAITLKEISA